MSGWRATGEWMTLRPAEGRGDACVFLPAAKVIHFNQRKFAMTRSQEVYEKVNALMDGGMSRADAFKQVANELGLKLHSARGSYYSFSRGATGSGKSRPRRRETTPEDALADARASLERSIQAIDREVETAGERAREAQLEYEALRSSAAERKAEISARLESLK